MRAPRIARSNKPGVPAQVRVLGNDLHFSVILTGPKRGNHSETFFLDSAVGGGIRSGETEPHASEAGNTGAGGARCSRRKKSVIALEVDTPRNNRKTPASACSAIPSPPARHRCGLRRVGH